MNEIDHGHGRQFWIKIKIQVHFLNFRERRTVKSYTYIRLYIKTIQKLLITKSSLLYSLLNEIKWNFDTKTNKCVLDKGEHINVRNNKKWNVSWIWSGRLILAKARRNIFGKFSRFFFRCHCHLQTRVKSRKNPNNTAKRIKKSPSNKIPKILFHFIILVCVSHSLVSMPSSSSFDVQRCRCQVIAIAQAA